MEERRRSPRQVVQGQQVMLSVAESIRVLEVSAGGVLFQSLVPVQPGTRARLRLSLAGNPLAAEVEVRRVSPELDAEAGYRIGAKFITVTPEHRQLIERFIKQ